MTNGSFVDYTNTCLLHCGISNSNGIVYNFDGNGHHQQTWREVIGVPLAAQTVGVQQIKQQQDLNDTFYRSRSAVSAAEHAANLPHTTAAPHACRMSEYDGQEAKDQADQCKANQNQLQKTCDRQIRTGVDSDRGIVDDAALKYGLDPLSPEAFDAALEQWHSAHIKACAELRRPYRDTSHNCYHYAVGFLNHSGYGGRSDHTIKSSETELLNAPVIKAVEYLRNWQRLQRVRWLLPDPKGDPESPKRLIDGPPMQQAHSAMRSLAKHRARGSQEPYGHQDSYTPRNSRLYGINCLLCCCKRRDRNFTRP